MYIRLGKPASAASPVTGRSRISPRNACVSHRATANDTYLANLVGALNQLIWARRRFRLVPQQRDLRSYGRRDQGTEGSGIRAVFGHGSPKPDAKKAPALHISAPAIRTGTPTQSSLSDGDGAGILGSNTSGVDFSTWRCEHDFRLAKELRLIKHPCLGCLQPSQSRRVQAPNSGC